VSSGFNSHAIILNPTLLPSYMGWISVSKAKS